jgi:antitoxin component of MazEF toxin-antitoxin module
LNALHLKKGDHIEVEVEDGRIVLKPVLVIPRDQAWFWTPEWQAGEQEANEDLKHGRYTTVTNEAELMSHLDSLKGPQQ